MSQSKDAFELSWEGLVAMYNARPLKEYLVTIDVTHRETYTVKAHSSKEAVAKLKKSDNEYIYSREFLYTNPVRHWLALEKSRSEDQ